MKYIINILILNIFLLSSEAVATKNDIKMLIQYMDKRFESAQHNMDKRFDLMQHNMDKRFEAVDKRFESIDKRFESANNLMYSFMGLIGLIFTLIIWDRRTMMKASIKEASENASKLIKENEKQQNEILLSQLLKKADKNILDKVIKSLEEIYKNNKESREIFIKHNIKFST